MTRWARGSQGNRKQPLDASSWKDLKGTAARSHKYDATLHGQFKHNRRRLGRNWKPGDGAPNADRDSRLAVRVKRPDEPKTTNLAAELERVTNDVKLSAEDEKEIAVILKKEKRREERRVKRITSKQSGQTCYHCRETGHDMTGCPMLKNSTDSGSGICFKCGSTEHSLNQCRAKVPGGSLPYATCFICNEQGHLSKECPDNPRGLYPNGGCCRTCGSVEHYKRDCPDLRKQKGAEDILLTTLDQGSSSADAIIIKQKVTTTKKKKPKIVKF